MGVSKTRGKTPKMDGENNGKPYFLMDDLGGKPPIFGNTHIGNLSKSKHHHISIDAKKKPFLDTEASPWALKKPQLASVKRQKERDQ